MLQAGYGLGRIHLTGIHHMNKHDEWLTTRNAAELVGYHPAHIRLLIRRGEINAQKWGRDWMINRQSLLQYKARVEALGEKRGPKIEDI